MEYGKRKRYKEYEKRENRKWERGNVIWEKR
jgi:hypothetical protein